MRLLEMIKNSMVQGGASVGLIEACLGSWSMNDEDGTNGSPDGLEWPSSHSGMVARSIDAENLRKLPMQDALPTNIIRKD